MATSQTRQRAHNFQDLTGKLFHRWTVLEYAGKVGPLTAWRCRCECGVERVVQTGNLNAGVSRSCGCLRDEETRVRETTHGMIHTPEYQTWQAMRSRCGNPNNHCYSQYGGRGIRVCQEWQDSFEAFFAHVGKKPSAAHTIERINNDGHYEPGNVKWATAAEQSLNKRTNRLVCFRGETLPLAEWSRRLGIKYHTLCTRFRLGWTVEAAFTVPLQKSRHHTYSVKK
jgi:hypothetical protein